MAPISPAVRSDLAPTGKLRVGINHGNLVLAQKNPATGEVKGVAVDLAHELGRRLDALVNNAAWNISIPFPDLEALDAGVWDRLFSTNLRGPYLLCRAAAPHLKASGSGRIVNIASVAGLNPGGSSIAYATSKAGLIHLTRCLAVALAPQVTVNCVAPGLMEGTRMTSRLRPELADGARQRAVLKRAARVEDVADQVAAFCRSDSVTGQVLNIDAGVFFH